MRPFSDSKNKSNSSLTKGQRPLPIGVFYNSDCVSAVELTNGLNGVIPLKVGSREHKGKIAEALTAVLADAGISEKHAIFALDSRDALVQRRTFSERLSSRERVLNAKMSTDDERFAVTENLQPDQLTVVVLESEVPRSKKQAKADKRTYAGITRAKEIAEVQEIAKAVGLTLDAITYLPFGWKLALRPMGADAIVHLASTHGSLVTFTDDLFDVVSFSRLFEDDWTEQVGPKILEQRVAGIDARSIMVFGSGVNDSALQRLQEETRSTITVIEVSDAQGVSIASPPWYPAYATALTFLPDALRAKFEVVGRSGEEPGLAEVAS